MMCFQQLDAKFRMSCQHIELLNREIEMIQVRYDRSFSASQRTFRYSHRLKLATFEGMRNMYYEHACRCADRLEQIQDVFIDRGLMSENDDSEGETNRTWIDRLTRLLSIRRQLSSVINFVIFCRKTSAFHVLFPVLCLFIYCIT